MEGGGRNLPNLSIDEFTFSYFCTRARLANPLFSCAFVVYGRDKSFKVAPNTARVIDETRVDFFYCKAENKFPCWNGFYKMAGYCRDPGDKTLHLSANSGGRDEVFANRDRASG